MGGFGKNLYPERRGKTREEIQAMMKTNHGCPVPAERAPGDMIHVTTCPICGAMAQAIACVDAPDVTGYRHIDYERPSGVYAEIEAERERQDAQWGGPAHDDQHELEDWRRFRTQFEDRIEARWKKGVSRDDELEEYFATVRGSLVKIAALAVAQVEVLDRAMADHRRGEERE